MGAGLDPTIGTGMAAGGRTVDVVVVGGGLAGLTAAATAAGDGRSVVLLDGRPGRQPGRHRDGGPLPVQPGGARPLSQGGGPARPGSAGRAGQGIPAATPRGHGPAGRRRRPAAAGSGHRDPQPARLAPRAHAAGPVLAGMPGGDPPSWGTARRRPGSTSSASKPDDERQLVEMLGAHRDLRGRQPHGVGRSGRPAGEAGGAGQRGLPRRGLADAPGRPRRRVRAGRGGAGPGHGQRGRARGPARAGRGRGRPRRRRHRWGARRRGRHDAARRGRRAGRRHPRRHGVRAPPAARLVGGAGRADPRSLPRPRARRAPADPGAARSRPAHLPGMPRAPARLAPSGGAVVHGMRYLGAAEDLPAADSGTSWRTTPGWPASTPTPPRRPATGTAW